MKRRWRKRLLVLAVCYLLLELVSLLGLFVLFKARGVSYQPIRITGHSEQFEVYLDQMLTEGSHYLVHDPVLGWAIKPGGAFADYFANNQGMRGSRDYAVDPSPDVLRIATFGDSFTHGDDVPEPDTWQVRLEQQMKGIEVLNFGVSAFGPGQSYLRYHENGRQFGAHIVLIGVMAENIFRVVNVFRPFYSPSYTFTLTKPRFALLDGELTLLPNPLPSIDDYVRLKNEPAVMLPQLGANDFYFQRRSKESPIDLSPLVRLTKLFLDVLSKFQSDAVLDSDGTYNENGEAFMVLTGVVERFYRDVERDGALPVVVIFPDGIRPVGGTAVPAYRPLLDWLGAKGFRFVDLQDGFDRHAEGMTDDDLHVGSWGHYSPAANGIVARSLRDYLVAEGLTDPQAVERAVRGK